MNAERFNKVTEEYTERYKGLLTMIWPTINDNGFNEHNQTVNFLSAYEKVSRVFNENISTWYEFQIPNGDKGDNRIDAIIINHTIKSILIVESKRFSQNKIKEKRRSLGEDLTRIINLDLENRFQSVFCDGESIHNYSFYGVLLFDLWTYSKNHEKEKETYELWSSFCDNHDIQSLFGFLCLDPKIEPQIASKSYLPTIQEVRKYENSTYHLGVFALELHNQYN